MSKHANPGPAYWTEIRLHDETLRRDPQIRRKGCPVTESIDIWEAEEPIGATSIWAAATLRVFGSHVESALVLYDGDEPYEGQPHDQRVRNTKVFNYDFIRGGRLVVAARLVTFAELVNRTGSLVRHLKPTPDEKRGGLHIPTDEDYAQLLSELDRGASGEYAVSLRGEPAPE